MSGLTVRDLLERKAESLSLDVKAGSEGLEREVPGPEISSPGLVLSGFTERFPRDRIQVLGETEITFLRSLDDAERHEAVETLIGFDLPCLIVTKGLEPPAELVEAADRTATPLVGTTLKTGAFYRRIKPYLEEEFAPRTAVHGSVADVYGVGLLFVGKSGIGKSECVLDLVERGHRLVADDVVLITRRGNDVLIGRGHELARHHMEIRGVGIIDIRALFGVRATRQQKRVEVVVQLEEWSDDHAYDRTGLDADTAEILGVTLPRVVIPLNPGKNITVIAEVIAMNHLLKYSGVDTARAFDQKLRKSMRPVREYLEEDNE
ncbi:MAG TPA: HPr(Ser) kinase/phosphatase [Gemmatimonadota bacterium]|nr:HPr(Ser) kinase/phosphatase [Gemmatimonadota bacterium]